MDRPAQQSAALRHLYVAVSSAENKLVRSAAAARYRCFWRGPAAAAATAACLFRFAVQATLLDLLRAFEATAPLSLVVCCG